jgi:hypothetical protein
MKNQTRLVELGAASRLRRSAATKEDWRLTIARCPFIPCSCLTNGGPPRLISDMVQYRRQQPAERAMEYSPGRQPSLFYTSRGTPGRGATAVPGSGSCVSRNRTEGIASPGGALGCSHGCSESAVGGRAEPVGTGRVFLHPRPGGAKVKHPPPRWGGRVNPPLFHEFRSPAANSTRGYNPRPRWGRSGQVIAVRVPSLPRAGCSSCVEQRGLTPWAIFHRPLRGLLATGGQGK